MTCPGMVLVPGGFLRRSPLYSADEQPVPTVRLAQFLMDREPVTNRRFRRFVQRGGYEEPLWWTPAGWRHQTSQGGTTPTYLREGRWGDDDEPVTGVNWWAALAYARFVGKSLPTEAQWEYACHGPDGETSPCGHAGTTLRGMDASPEREPDRRRPTQANAYQADDSVFGCRGMVGHVAEWCLDTYHPSPLWNDVDADGPLHFTDEADAHVVRGGGGPYSVRCLRGSSRTFYLPGWRDSLIGFRCAAPASARCLCHMDRENSTGVPR
jgi:iron(II)-dependent oxidoreductase